MVVLDASVALTASADEYGFRHFGKESLVAPPHMCSEARSSLHEALWRGELTERMALGTLERLEAAPVRSRTHKELGSTAWRLAEDFEWAKTYDAEYLALALLLDCRLVTLDSRLRRRTKELGVVIGPGEL